MSDDSQQYIPALAHDEWVIDCLRWRGDELMGKYCHWCFDWDGLPVDETTPEWPCGCFPDAT